MAGETKTRAVAPFLKHCAIGRTIGGDGTAHSHVVVEPHLENSANAAHGGLLMTMLDSALSGAARSTLGEDYGVMTLDMQIAFLSPGRGRLTGEGRVLRAGKTLIFCEGEIRDEAGILVAKGSGLFSPRRARPEKTT